MASKQRVADANKARDKADADAQAKKSSLDGFEQTLSPMMRGKAIAALTTKGITSNGTFYHCIRDLVRQRVAKGYTVTPRGLAAPDGSFLDEKQITKLGMAYAAYLIDRS